jgi:hypothetical protein
VSSDRGSSTIAAAYDAKFADTAAVDTMFAEAEVSMALLNFTNEQARDFLTSVVAANDANTEVFADIISEAAIQVILDRDDVAVDLSAFAGCDSCASAENISAALWTVVAVAQPGSAESTAGESIRALLLVADGEALSLASMDATNIDIFAAWEVAAIAACYGASVDASLYLCALAQLATSEKLERVVIISTNRVDSISEAFKLNRTQFDYLVGLSK